jgi:hypothetical protein
MWSWAKLVLAAAVGTAAAVEPACDIGHLTIKTPRHPAQNGNLGNKVCVCLAHELAVSLTLSIWKLAILLTGASILRLECLHSAQSEFSRFGLALLLRQLPLYNW